MSRFTLLRESFLRLCEEDEILAVEEIIHKKNYKERREYLKKEIDQVLKAMNKEIAKICERKIGSDKSDDDFENLVHEVFEIGK